MTRDDIIRMAREAGFTVDEADFITAPKSVRMGFQLEIERFAALVAAAEREACVNIIETHKIPVGNSAAGELACEWTYDALHQIRDEVRARGEKK